MKNISRPVLTCEIFVMNSFSTKPISFDAEFYVDHSKSAPKKYEFTEFALSLIHA
jgi:hypothetical protein